MRNPLLALAVLAILATPVAAQDTRVMLQGAGTASCSSINDYYRKYTSSHAVHEMDVAVGSWSSGFMTSANLARRVQGQDSRNLGAMTFAAQTLALRRWCQQHPNKKLLLAVMELFSTFPFNGDADETADLAQQGYQ